MTQGPTESPPIQSQQISAYPTQEIEAKFLLADDEEAASILKVLGELTRLSPKQPVDVVDTYLDSPDLDFWRVGYGCRIRHKSTDSASVWSLECKSIGSGADLVKTREEVEQRLPGPATAQDLPEAGVAIDLLQAHGITTRVPIVSIESRRRRFVAILVSPAGDASFEVSVDEVVIRSSRGEPDLRFRELEIERIDGAVESLHTLVGMLQTRLPLCVSRLGKMERAFWLNGRHPDSNRRFPAAEPATGLLRFQLWHDLRIIRLSREVALEGRDPEGIHRLRTHVRRVRATLVACKPWLGSDAAAFSRQFKTLADAAGELRDHDVYTAATLKMLDGFTQLEAKTRDRLAQVLESERSEFAGRTLEVLAGTGVEQLFGAFQTVIDQTGASGVPTVAEVASRELARRTRSVRKGMAQLIKTGRDESLHELRIRIKKLRYVLNLFEPVLGGGLLPLSLVLRDLQDVLGEHQDACVAIARGKQIARRVPLLPKNRDVLITFGRLQQEQERTAAAIRERFVARKGRKALARELERVIRGL